MTTRRSMNLMAVVTLLLSLVLGGCVTDKQEQKAADDVVMMEAGEPVKKSNIGYDADSNFITVLYTRAFTSGTINYVEGYIEAAKPSYDRTITIHYAIDNDLTKWYNDTTSAKYFAESPNGAPGTREILYFKKQIKQKITFAVKYTRPGMRDYWDNNAGKDFVVGVASGVSQYSLGTTSVVLDKFAALTNSVKYQRALSGTIVLKNLAYTKDVRVVYSTDGWKSSQTIGAKFGESYYGLEKWNFDGYLPLSITSAKFKVVYVVNGQTYVDDNFGKYYTATWK